MLWILRLRKKVRAKTKEDKISFSQHIQALIISKGRPRECGSSGCHNQKRSKCQGKKKVIVIIVKSKNT